MPWFNCKDRMYIALYLCRLISLASAEFILIKSIRLILIYKSSLDHKFYNLVHKVTIEVTAIPYHRQVIKE